MKHNNSQEKQECFIQQAYQQIQTKYLQAQFNLQVPITLNKQLPANQLRNIIRPQNMFPRTFNDNKIMSILPSVLNLKCVQVIQKSKLGTINLKIPNKEKLSLYQYFMKTQFKSIYNRLNHFYADSKSFTGKLRSVDSLGDYNHKMFKQLQQNNSSTEESHHQEIIDSDFQCGNLCRAFKKNSESNDFYLMIENDINTHGYNIWFFFRFKNKSKGIRTFHLLNMIKKTQNYKKGMQISIFSMKNYQKQKRLWEKGCDKITFGETNFPRMFHQTEKYYHLSFQYDFQEEDDQVYFAMNQPYTYSRMIQHIQSLKLVKKNQDIKIQTKIVGHSLADNIIPYVRIWAGQYESKQTILITARQHPSQTVGSFICQGIINDLINAKLQIKILLQKFQFIIIPMINPDGVIHGSSRCNLAGFDLNRQWSQFLIKEFTPQTHRIKKFLNNLNKQNNIKYFFDLHGHGKKLNSFLFSCKKGDRPTNRLIQLVMNKIQPRFNILDCTYGIDRDKENTIRSQLFQMGVQNCYTLQTSLFGYVNQSGQIEHFNQADFQNIGYSLLKSIFAFDNNSDYVKEILGFSKQQIYQSSLTLIQKIVEKQKNQNKKNINDNASDSDPDGDILDMKQRIQTCCKNTNLKKKISQTLKKQKLVGSKSVAKNSTKKWRKNSLLSQNEDGIVTGLYLLSNQIKKTHEPLDDFAQDKKNINLLSLKNKRTIYSKKIKEKKEPVIQSTKRIINQPQGMNKTQYNKNSFRDKINSTQIKFFNKKLKNDIKNDQKAMKTSSSIVCEYPNQGMLYKQKQILKIKTQQSQRQIPGVFYQDKDIQSKKQLRFKQLRDQSLKELLYDTFTILKAKPKLSIKKYVKINMQQRQKKHQQLLSRIQRHNTDQQKFIKQKIQSKKRLKTFSCRQNNFSQRYILKNQLDARKSTKIDNKDSPDSKKRNLDFKFKRFENFLYSDLSSYKDDQQKNSVFYYFPVL